MLRNENSHSWLSQEKCDQSKVIPSRPFITKEQSVVLAQKLFSLEMSPLASTGVKELDSYDDRNFLVKGRPLTGSQKKGEEVHMKEETWFVLKVTNSLTSQNRDLLGVISDVLDFISSRGIQCPVPSTSVFGNKLVPCKILDQERSDCSTSPDENVNENEITEGIVLSQDNNGGDHKDVCMVRMFTFVHGDVLCDVTWTYDLLFDLGVKIARLHKILKGFSEANRWIIGVQLQDPNSPWDLRNISAVVSSYAHALDTISQVNLVQEISQRFQREVFLKLEKLDVQIIHADLNEHNIIVGRDSNGVLTTQGFIDFNEMQHSNRVLDFATSLGYIMIESVKKNLDVIQASGHMFAGYQSEFPLGPVEIDMLLVSAKARICQSLVMGAYQYKYVTPENEYALYTAKKGWKVLDDLGLISGDDVLRAWKSCTKIRLV